VSEDVPVGTIIGINNLNLFCNLFIFCKFILIFIGVLKINGDTSETGNINLSLKEVDSPIAILPGTKELTLTKLLDKEVYYTIINLL